MGTICATNSLGNYRTSCLSIFDFLPSIVATEANEKKYQNHLDKTLYQVCTHLPPLHSASIPSIPFFHSFGLVFLSQPSLCMYDACMSCLNAKMYKQERAVQVVLLGSNSSGKSTWRRYLSLLMTHTSMKDTIQLIKQHVMRMVKVVVKLIASLPPPPPLSLVNRPSGLPFTAHISDITRPPIDEKKMEQLKDVQHILAQLNMDTIVISSTDAHVIQVLLCACLVLHFLYSNIVVVYVEQ
jgi:hypothetical protein